MNAKRSISAALLLFSGVAGASQTLETMYRINGEAVKSAFEPTREILQNCSAVIEREVFTDRGGRKVRSYASVACGTVMTAEGFILTKASEVTDTAGLIVRVGPKLFKDPRVMAVDPLWDVALLKVEATGLTPVQLATDQPDPERGTWVVANGASSMLKRMLQVGIIAANAREIQPGGGVIGISLTEEEKKLIVDQVEEESGAAKAGLQEDDVIVAVDGQDVTDLDSMAKILEKRRKGEEVAVTIERDGNKMDLKVTLGEEMTRNDQMSGNRLSERRNGFPRVIQHDIIAQRSEIGGPLLDLDGRCLGMNIARANRCETFAIPAGDLRSLADRLMTQAEEK